MCPSEGERLAGDSKANEASRTGAGKVQADTLPADTPVLAASKARKPKKEHTDLWADALGEELTDDELEGVVGGIST